MERKVEAKKKWYRVKCKLRSAQSHKETHHKPKAETRRSFKFLSKKTSSQKLKRMFHKNIYL